jgi:uncharacterized membrane protein
MDYTIIQPNRELRACARRQLKGVWLSMVLAFLVFTLICTGPYFISSSVDAFLNSFDLFYDILNGSNWNIYDYYDDYDGYGTPSPITWILQLAIYLTSGAFALGFAGYFLRRVRDEEFALKNIFDGFKRFWSALFLFFLQFLFIFLWSLLLIVPGIIKSISYSMSYYILSDNPEMSAPDALKKSQIMMKGYKGKYFMLCLSFFGWSLLALLTLGIGYLWLYPYISLSIANFYENLKISQEKALRGDQPTGTAEEEKIEIARKMKERGRPLDEIVEDTGLSLDIVENL